jgi:ubiquinone/menaquinone biosynthesis C-methylase UbiE
MGEEQDRQMAVGAHYDRDEAYASEIARLETLGPVERAMTERILARLVPPGCMVADVGVGAGHYDEFLALRGCSLCLVDVSQRLLQTARDRLHARDCSGCVVDSVVASATHLGHLADESCDAVLLLGPLYHLLTLPERRQAVAEAHRVLRPGGVLLAAAISRLAGLHAEYLCWPERGAERRDRLTRFLADGLVGPEDSATLGQAFFTTAFEFRELFAGDFDEVVLAGIESFTGCEQESFSGLSDDDKDAWLDLVERTMALPEALGCCEHYLYAGRKR